jgi:hypothetical protein
MTSCVALSPLRYRSLPLPSPCGTGRRYLTPFLLLGCAGDDAVSLGLALSGIPGVWRA